MAVPLANPLPHSTILQRYPRWRLPLTAGEKRRKKHSNLQERRIKNRNCTSLDKKFPRALQTLQEILLRAKHPSASLGALLTSANAWSKVGAVCSSLINPREDEWFAEDPTGSPEQMCDLNVLLQMPGRCVNPWIASSPSAEEDPGHGEPAFPAGRDTLMVIQLPAFHVGNLPLEIKVKQ